MKNNERPNLKQIRIKRSVCERLDERKGKDDSYTDVVKELLDENDRLIERNIELERDKETLTHFIQSIPIDLKIKDATAEEKAKGKEMLEEAGFNVNVVE